MYPAHWAATTPDRKAVVVADTGAYTTYRDLDRTSRRLANLFTDRGLDPGDHVAVLLDNTTQFIDVIWGALLAGVHVTPISKYATAEDAAYILQDSDARLLVTSSRASAVATALPAAVGSCRNWLMIDGVLDGYESYETAVDNARDDAVAPDRPLGEYMLYSSGTTGRPKGVLRPTSGRTIAQGSIANKFMTKVFGFSDHTVYLSPAPLYHGAPLGFTIGTTSLGGTAVVMAKFDPEKALAAIASHGVTHSQWVPTMFNRLLALPQEVRDEYDVTSQEVVIHSAAPCPRHIKEAMFEWFGPVIHEYYSGTEDVGVTYASPQDWLAHPGTVGRPLGFTIHICAEDGTELPALEAGLVYFETRTKPFTYHKDDTKTKKSRHPVHDNWVSLDDIGYLDDDGFLYLTDRASFMIISGGVNIYPQEIENVLITHPAVLDVAVIGVPNDDMGEEVKAIVELAPGYEPSTATSDSLLDFAKKELAGPKRPRTVDFVDTLPRLATGKLAKNELRKPYWNR